MKNGNRLTLVRIIASTVISMVAVIVAGWLLHSGVDIPAAWWMITALAVGGVAGADVVSAVLRSKEAQGERDSGA